MRADTAWFGDGRDGRPAVAATAVVVVAAEEGEGERRAGVQAVSEQETRARRQQVLLVPLLSLDSHFQGLGLTLLPWQ